jgi:hypothetical protein
VISRVITTLHRQSRLSLQTVEFDFGITECNRPYHWETSSQVKQARSPESWKRACVPRTPKNSNSTSWSARWASTSRALGLVRGADRGRARDEEQQEDGGRLCPSLALMGWHRGYFYAAIRRYILVECWHRRSMYVIRTRSLLHILVHASDQFYFRFCSTDIEGITIGGHCVSLICDHNLIKATIPWRK